MILPPRAYRAAGRAVAKRVAKRAAVRSYVKNAKTRRVIVDPASGRRVRISRNLRVLKPLLLREKRSFKEFYRDVKRELPRWMAVHTLDDSLRAAITIGGAYATSKFVGKRDAKKRARAARAVGRVTSVGAMTHKKKKKGH